VVLLQPGNAIRNTHLGHGLVDGAGIVGARVEGDRLSRFSCYPHGLFAGVRVLCVQELVTALEGIFRSDPTSRMLAAPHPRINRQFEEKLLVGKWEHEAEEVPASSVLDALDDVLRLKTAGVAINEIARRVGVASSTVRLTLKRLAAAGLGWPLPPEMTDTALVSFGRSRQDSFRVRLACARSAERAARIAQ
jgi:hypothetical protein